jgi:small-conductance mechanosensitive channel
LKVAGTEGAELMLLDILSGHTFETKAYGEIVFLMLCMGAAWMTGRSIAGDWKPLWALALGVLGLGFATRFLHHALYYAEFLSFDRFLLDTLLLGVVAYIGYRFTRTNQMTRQYHWLYEKASPFSWRAKS